MAAQAIYHGHKEQGFFPLSHCRNMKITANSFCFEGYGNFQKMRRVSWIIPIDGIVSAGSLRYTRKTDVLSVKNQVRGWWVLPWRKCARNLNLPNC